MADFSQGAELTSPRWAFWVHVRSMARLSNISRGVALFFGVVFALDALRGLTGHGAGLWLDFRPAPHWLELSSLMLLSTLLTAHALRPAKGARRAVTGLAAMYASWLAALNCVSVWRLELAGTLDSSPLPLSLLTFSVFALFAWLLLSESNQLTPTTGRRAALESVGCAVVAGIVFSLGQIGCGYDPWKSPTGDTNYTRDADAVVVLGARVYASGRPSLALEDRARTGARLVRGGHASILVLSGGPGDGSVHETDAMRRIALREGVPESAIVIDRHGTSTRATANNLAALLAARQAGRVLAVSHGYHLPRVRLAMESVGLSARTVPAEETRSMPKLPWFVAREVVAFWLYYGASGVAPSLIGERA